MAPCASKRPFGYFASLLPSLIEIRQTGRFQRYPDIKAFQFIAS
jgi:hypothetical protein